jgi:hypothetical protein
MGYTVERKEDLNAGGHGSLLQEDAMTISSSPAAC